MGEQDHQHTWVEVDRATLPPFILAARRCDCGALQVDRTPLSLTLEELVDPGAHVDRAELGWLPPGIPD
jgi:hypothetical protein